MRSRLARRLSAFLFGTAALLVVLGATRAASAQVPTFTPIETFTPFRTFTPNQTFTPVKTFTPIQTFTPFPTVTPASFHTATPTRPHILPTRTRTPPITLAPSRTPTPTPRTPTRSPTAPPATPTRVICAADCTGDGHVTVDELVLSVLIALNQSTLASCPGLDVNQDGEVSIGELIHAVQQAQGPCR